MSDPMSRAKNGDAEFFKRVPVGHILNLKSQKVKDSVLSVSVSNNHIHCSRVILQRFPSLLYQQNKTGRTALHYAAWKGMPTIAKLLIHGAEEKLFRIRDFRGNTPLMDAVSRQHLQMVKLLIQADPDYQYTVIDTRETRYCLLSDYPMGKQVMTFQLLLEKQPSQCKVCTGDNGWTALHRATSKGDLGSIQDIIQFCPESTDIIDKQGQKKYVHVVEYVVNAKEIVAGLLNKKNNNGDTPLDIAAKTGNRQIILCLQYAPTIAGYENEREKEFCIPPKYLELYRGLVKHFGERVPPHLSLSLNEFLCIVFEMIYATPKTLTEEHLYFWEEKLRNYTGVGLQVSWLQKHVTRLRDWLATKNENISHLEDEITTKEKELTYLRAKLHQFHLDFGFRLLDQ